MRLATRSKVTAMQTAPILERAHCASMGSNAHNQGIRLKYEEASYFGCFLTGALRFLSPPREGLIPEDDYQLFSNRSVTHSNR